MTGHGTKFTRKMEQAVIALLIQRNVEEAARSVGIGAATLMRWQKLPEFQKAYREARHAAYFQTIARLQQASSTAATVLLKVMVDQTTPPAARIRAADMVLEHSSRSIELEDMETRLAALEQLAKQAKPPGAQS